MNYGVPRFGMDRDIQGGLVNIGEAEKIVGHRWHPSFGTGKYKSKYVNPAKSVMYNFAPDLDADIRHSIKNLADTEKKLDHDYSLVQIESDPICNSAGCT